MKLLCFFLYSVCVFTSHQTLVCPILVCLDHSVILGNLTTSVLWKDVALLELKLCVCIYIYVYIYTHTYINVVLTLYRHIMLQSHRLLYVHKCGTVQCNVTHSACRWPHAMAARCSSTLKYKCCVTVQFVVSVLLLQHSGDVPIKTIVNVVYKTYYRSYGNL
jgi:hypothetical protein